MDRRRCAVSEPSCRLSAVAPEARQRIMIRGYYLGCPASGIKEWAGSLSADVGEMPAWPGEGGQLSLL